MATIQVLKAVKAVIYSRYHGKFPTELKAHISSFLDPSYTTHPKMKHRLLTRAIECGFNLSWIKHICVIRCFEFRWKDLNNALNEVAKCGNIEMLEWMMENLIFARGYDDISVYLLDAAASTGQIEMLLWLDDKPYARVASCSFSKIKNLETFKWMYGKLSRKCNYFPSKRECWFLHEAAKQAAQNGQLDILKYIHQQTGLSSENGHELIERAAQTGDLDLIQWLHLVLDGKYTKTTMMIACARGDLENIEWLVAHSSFLPQSSDRLKCLETPMEAAAMCGKLEVVQWISQMNQKDKKSVLWECTPDVLDHAARRGYLNIVKWLHFHTTYGCTTDAMDNAAAYGHLEVVIWLHKNRNEGCSVEGMNKAARWGEFEMVKWLHANRTEGCTTDAMDFAAANGDLKMVQWLHANRREGCSKNAMDLAARNGHLHIIQWLHDNRTEGCTTNAMDLAAENGHLKVLQWLHKNRTEGCTPEAMNKAARTGNFEIVKWLYANREDGLSRDALKHSACSGHLEIVQWLHINNIIQEKASPEIMRGALTCGHLDIAKWLWANGYAKCDVFLNLFGVTGGVPMIKWILAAFRPELRHRMRHWWSDGCASCSEIEKEIVLYEQQHKQQQHSIALH
jgi:hypothetical protein